MRDNNLIHVAQTAIAADAFSTNALTLNKTDGKGIWLEFVVSRDGADADETVQILIYGKDTDAGWSATADDVVGGAGILTATDCLSGGAAVRVFALVQTKFKYIKAYYDVGGTTPDWDVESWGVVSGPQRDTLA